MKKTITIVRLITITIYLIIFAMSFGLIELNGLLVASLFIVQIYIFCGFISTLNAHEYGNVPKGWLYYLTNTISAILILFMLFGQIEFWYMVILSHIILFGAVIVFKRKAEHELLESRK